jgi:hypothetical protein
MACVRSPRIASIEMWQPTGDEATNDYLRDLYCGPIRTDDPDP